MTLYDGNILACKQTKINIYFSGTFGLMCYDTDPITVIVLEILGDEELFKRRLCLLLT